MKDLDKNGDGIIDFEEFKQHMLQLIDKGDFKYRPTLQKLESNITVETKPVAVAE